MRVLAGCYGVGEEGCGGLPRSIAGSEITDKLGYFTHCRAAEPAVISLPGLDVGAVDKCDDECQHAYAPLLSTRRWLTYLTTN
jgi:hypothetical protein